MAAMTVPLDFQSRGFKLARAILQFYRAISRTSDVPRPVANQMLRAGTSIGANLEEAKSAQSRRDLISKYMIALREARECRYWLRLIAVDQPQLSTATSPLVDECGQIVAILTTTVKKLRAEPTRSFGDKEPR